ncbi:MAG: peroxiredoxin [Pseudomonadales bacterium]
MLKVGDTAPNFTLPDQNGSTVSLDELVTDGNVILYFYPADFSPVCTAEACAFRDNYDGVANVGAQIVGVSPQGVSSHSRFSKSFAIPFPLLSDPRKKVIRAYGVDGPLGFGVRRVTFLIDSSRTIRNRVVSDLFVESHMGLLKKTLSEPALI